MQKAENSSIGSRRSFSGLWLLLYVGLPFLLWRLPLSSLMGGHSICVFKNLLGHECWGCGMTRALFSLLHGKVQAALDFHPMVLVVGAILVYLYIRGLVELWRRFRQEHP